MSRHTSQNPLPRSPQPAPLRRRQMLLSLITGLAFLACVVLAVERIPHTELGRSVGNHLGQLADPTSWLP